MTFWSSLYLPCADAAPVVETARTALTSLGYTLFNPFGLIPGKSYPRAVRLFVAPARDGWTRLIGETDARLPAALSDLAPTLALALDGADATVDVYADGAASTLDALAPCLRPGRTVDELRQVARMPALRLADANDDGGLPLDALPGDVQSMAGRINMKQANRLFARMTGDLVKRGGQANAGDLAGAARGLIAAGQPPDWASAGGRRLRALMDCLTVPDDWQAPDFTTLRDAYQVAERQRRKPGADLYPGDAEALAAVPDALDYVPVYGGANASL